MTSQPLADPAPADPAEPDPAAVDAALAHLATTSADILTGLITAGLLHTAGTPTKLPALLWPDTDPAVVQHIWNTALATGLWAGQQRGRPRWEPESMDQALTDLMAAGYTAMAGKVRTAAAHGRRHPADIEPPARDHQDEP